MPKWSPCKRRDFIRRLRKLGFDGPFAGSRHEFMTFDYHRLAIPSNSEYSTSQLRFMLREVENIIDRKISLHEWEYL
jgi:hypothetical protein